MKKIILLIFFLIVLISISYGAVIPYPHASNPYNMTWCFHFDDNLTDSISGLTGISVGCNYSDDSNMTSGSSLYCAGSVNKYFNSLVQNIPLSTESTVSLWIKVNGTPTAQGSVYYGQASDGGSRFDLTYRTTPAIQAVSYKNSGSQTYIISSGGNIADNTWHHIAVTTSVISGGKTSLSYYFNGINQSLATDNSKTQAYGNLSNTLFFASVNLDGNPSNGINMTIDDLCISNTTALKPSSILSIANGDYGGDETAPLFTQYPKNLTIEFYTDNLNININATDETELDIYFINDTSRFKINETNGSLENNTALTIGVYFINISVNDTSNNINSTILNINVTDTISPLFNQTPKNRTLEYYLDSLLITFNASDYSPIDSFFVNDSLFSINSTGSLINATKLNVTNYCLNISVNDTSNNINSTILNINVTDTILPLFTTFENITIENGSIYIWNETLTDSALYSFNIVCDNGFNFSATNIGQTEYNFINNQTTITADTLCNFNVSDAHTKKNIKDINFIKNTADKKLSFGKNNHIKSNKNILNIETKKKKDKYSICFETENIEENIIFNVSDSCIKYPMDTFKGWYVCENSYWIDFEGEYTISVNDNQVSIDLSESNDTMICFNSIGILNTVYGSQLIKLKTNIYDNNIISETNWFNINDLDTSSTSGILLHFFIFIIIVGILIYGEIIKVPALFLLDGLLLFFYALLIFTTISAIVGIILIVMCLIIFFRGVTIAKQ